MDGIFNRVFLLSVLYTFKGHGIWLRYSVMFNRGRFRCVLWCDVSYAVCRAFVCLAFYPAWLVGSRGQWNNGYDETNACYLKGKRHETGDFYLLYGSGQGYG